MADDEVAIEEKEFLAETAVMNLAPLKEETFCVAVATGDPKNVKFLCSTIHGPYSFIEMANEVGEM